MIEHCHLLNVSICPLAQARSAARQPFAITVYNGIARPRSEVVFVPVEDDKFGAFMEDGRTPILAQLLPASLSASAWSGSSYRLLAFTASMPSLRTAVYILKPVAAQAVTPEVEQPATDPFTVENDVFSLRFVNGRLASVTNKRNGLTAAVRQELFWYPSYRSVPETRANQSSGAYIFRPETNTPVPVLAMPAEPTVTILSKNANPSIEVRQQFTPWVNQTIRLLAGSNSVELEWSIGPVPWEDGVGKELISRFDTDIASGGLLWTDSNGREMLQRKRDFRPTFPLRVTEPVAGNYYPVTVAAFIRDATRQLTIVTDRAQGAASIKVKKRMSLCADLLARWS